MKTKTTEERVREAEEFVSRLKPLASDAKRGERAALRRYWSEGTRAYALPILGKLSALGNSAKTYTAALYALHPSHAQLRSFGDTCRRIAGTNRDTFEPHFRRLLSATDIEDLGDQLYRLVKRAECEGVPVNYVQLLRDLNGWKFYSEDVKTRWAKDFWQAIDPLDNEDSTTLES
ncbi:MAG: type I-E CRISPR-associated protein Cse2/CasB [Verrucomicrobiae bacterium]|nr:type I-E CRISPR-associated protein Cse2/CasB [Verrucomicrobiae bacterium]